MSIELIEKIFSDELTESTEIFNTLLADRIAVKLDERKIEVAKGLFGGISEAKKESEDDEEAEQKSFNDTNPLGQLKSLGDSNPNSKEENEIRNADGSLNKNSATPKEGSRAKTAFIHKNGEQTDVAPNVAKILVQKIALYKPEHASRLLDAIHSNKQGYSQAVSEILQDHHSPELSVYKFKSKGELKYKD